MFGRTRVLLGLVASMAVLAVPASASAAGLGQGELRFFAQQVSSTFENGRFETQDVLYPGNRGIARIGIGDAFARGPVGHARLSCVFWSDSWALCNGKIAIQGGTMLARNVFVRFGGDTTVVELNGGTGEFAGKHGSVRSVSVTDSVSLFTINFG